MMQSQSHFTSGHDETEKVESERYKFWCCQCKNEINDAAGINDIPSSQSNGVVVTRQPVPSSHSSCGHNNFAFSSYVSETKNGFSEREHQLDSSSGMTASLKRLREESTNVTSAVLDNLISESKFDPEEKLKTKNSLKLQDIIGSTDDMEDIIIASVADNVSELLPISAETKNAAVHKEQNLHGNSGSATNYSNNEESKKMNNVSNAFSVPKQASEVESFEGNSSPVKELESRLTEIAFLNDGEGAGDSEHDIDSLMKSTDNLANFASCKLPEDDVEVDSISMICIPDDDLIVDKDEMRKLDTSMEIESKIKSATKCNDEALVQTNKMYASNISSSSSSDNDEVHEIVSPNNSMKTSDMLKGFEDMDISIKKLNNAKNDGISGERDDRLIIKNKSDKDVKMFTGDVFNERLI
uniref:Uncharacterized protein n=1 Tax=Setaria digitata TaxID=48799 RepID=A0A915PQ64_9BILA